MHRDSSERASLEAHTRADRIRYFWFPVAIRAGFDLLCIRAAAAFKRNLQRSFSNAGVASERDISKARVGRATERWFQTLG